MRRSNDLRLIILAYNNYKLNLARKLIGALYCVIYGPLLPHLLVPLLHTNILFSRFSSFLSYSMRNAYSISILISDRNNRLMLVKSANRLVRSSKILLLLFSYYYYYGQLIDIST